MIDSVNRVTLGKYRMITYVLTFYTLDQVGTSQRKDPIQNLRLPLPLSITENLGAFYIDKQCCNIKLAKTISFNLNVRALYIKKQ